MVKTVPCPDCGEPISEDDAQVFTMKLGPDPLEAARRLIGRTGFFSGENLQTVAKAELAGKRFRGKFNRPHTI